MTRHSNAAAGLAAVVVALMLVGVAIGPRADATPRSAPTVMPAAMATGPAGSFVPLPPARLLDTRVGSPVSAGGKVVVGVAGRAGVPESGASSVLVNVTATAARAAGHLTVYQTGTPRPDTSTVNFVAGLDVSNHTVVPVGADGTVTVAVGGTGTVHVIVDVSGYHLPPSDDPAQAGGFIPLTPQRIVDTRDGRGTGQFSVAPHSSISVAPSILDVPDSVDQLVVNVTVLAGIAPGHLSLSTNASTPGGTSVLNFGRWETRANLVFASRSFGNVLHNGSAAAVNVLIDLLGYERRPEQPSGTARTGYYLGTPSNGVRLVDTRVGVGLRAGRVGAGAVVDVDVAGGGGAPSFGVAAVVLTVVAVAPQTPGNVVVFPGTTSTPNASDLNAVPGRDVAATVVVPVGRDGRVRFRVAATGSTDLVVDQSGYYLGEGWSSQASASGFLQNPQHDNYGAGPVLRGDLRVRWSVDLGERGTYPVVADGFVFAVAAFPIGSAPARLTARRVSDGTEVWSATGSPGSDDMRVAYDNGVLFTQDDNGVIRARTAQTGRQLWQSTALSSASLTSLTVAHGLVLVPSDGVTALDQATGRLRWRTSVLDANSAPAVDDTGIYLAKPCHGFVRLDFTGTVLWSRDIGCSSGFPYFPALHAATVWDHDPGGAVGEVVASETGDFVTNYDSEFPVAFNQATAVLVRNNDVTAVNLRTGRMLWRTVLPGYTQNAAVISGGRAFVGLGNGEVLGLRLADGAVDWTGSAGGPVGSSVDTPTSGLAVSDGVLVVPGGDRLTVFEPVT